MTNTCNLVDHVRKALIRVDACTEGVPDYDVLAETAVAIVIERLLLALAKLGRKDEEA